MHRQVIFPILARKNSEGCDSGSTPGNSRRSVPCRNAAGFCPPTTVEADLSGSRAMGTLVLGMVWHHCLPLKVWMCILSRPLCIPRWSIAAQTILSDFSMLVRGDAISIRSSIVLLPCIVLSSVAVEGGVLPLNPHHCNSGSNLGSMVSPSLPTSMGCKK